MRYHDVVRHFGSVKKAADALEVTRQAVYTWRKRRRIPYDTQCRIQVRTGGAIIADVRHT